MHLENSNDVMRALFVHPKRNSFWIILTIANHVFIYFRVISHELVSASLRKPCGFFPWFLTGIPLILFPFISTHLDLFHRKTLISSAKYHVQTACPQLLSS